MIEGLGILCFVIRLYKECLKNISGDACFKICAHGKYFISRIYKLKFIMLFMDNRW